MGNGQHKQTGGGKQNNNSPQIKSSQQSRDTWTNSQSPNTGGSENRCIQRQTVYSLHGSVTGQPAVTTTIEGFGGSQQTVNVQAEMDPAALETANFCRVVCLILNVCTDALRDLLRCKIKGGELILTKDIAANKAKLEKHKKMSDVERKKLFPTGSVLVRYESLDISLMYSIARNVCPEKIEPDLSKKWGKRPAVGNTSLLAAIETIRLSRNDYYAHATEARIPEHVFQKIWKELEIALSKINDNLERSIVFTDYKKEMANLKSKQIDRDSEKIICEMAKVERKLNDYMELTDISLLELTEKFTKLEEQLKPLICDGYREHRTEPDSNLDQTIYFLTNHWKTDLFYVKTGIFEKANDHLKKFKLAILVGREGTGKTAMAVHLMLQLKSEGFEARLLQDPKDVTKYLKPNRKQLLFIDNVFEKCCKDEELNLLFYCINEFTCEGDKKQAYIIMTSRPQKLNTAMNNMGSYKTFVDRCTIDFDSEDSKLHHSEKKAILQSRMAYARSDKHFQETIFTDEELEDIFQFTPPIGFPLCADLFACKKDGDDGKDFFSNPQEHILSTLEEIIKDERKGKIKIFLLLLLIHHLRNEPFNCKEPEKYWEILCEMQIDKEMRIKKEQIYDMKADSFDCEKMYVMKNQEDEFHFMHQSVQQAVQNYFFENYRLKAIEILPIPVLCQKMQTEYFLSLEPKYQEHFIRRVRKEIKIGNVYVVCEYKELRDKEVSQQVLKYFMENETDVKDILNSKNDDDGLPFIYWFTRAACNETVRNLLEHETIKRVCSDREMFELHFFSLLASCALQGKMEIIKYILLKYPEGEILKYYECRKIHQSLTETQLKVLSPLLIAYENRNDDAMRMLTECGATFPRSIWKGWPFLHACSREKEWQIACQDILEQVLEFDERNKCNQKHEYTDILNEKPSVSAKIVLNIHNSIGRHGSQRFILLCLAKIPEIEITNGLIEAFCSLPDLKNETKPLNLVDDEGNSVLHIFLQYRWYHQGTLGINSDDPNENLTTIVSMEKPCKLPESKLHNEAHNLNQYKDIENTNNYLQAIKRLLSKTADINLKNKQGDTPLMVEINKLMPSIEVIISLLHYGANLNDNNSVLHTLLSNTYGNGINICQFLAILCRFKVDLNKQNKSGEYPIFVALNNREPVVISFLIDAAIDMTVLDGKGRTVLIVALQAPDYNDIIKSEIVKILLRLKCSNVHYRDNTGKSAFSIAITYLSRNSDILRQVADHESCEYPLHECIKEQVSEDVKIQVLDFLLKNTKAVNQHALNQDKETLLITAAKVCPDMDSLFLFLLRQNVDINAKDVCNRSALDYLITSSNNLDFRNKKSTLICLIEKNPTVDEENQERSPLSKVMEFIMSKSFLWTASKTPSNIFVDEEIVRKILEIAKTDLHYIDDNGRTYLHYCASTPLGDEQMPTICKRLVELGVDVDKKDNDGLTCIDMALKFTGKENYHTLVYLIANSNLESFDVDKSLQILADGDNLYADIVRYFIENIFDCRKPKKNILHYLAANNYDPKNLSKTERGEIFDYLQKSFAVDEKNSQNNIPLHVAINQTSSVSCVLNFFRISKQCINISDRKGDTALHLVLKSNRDDNAVCTLVKQMIENKDVVNTQNKLHRTPLMDAVNCPKDRLISVAYILKMWPEVDLLRKDRDGFTVLHHCIKTQKDDFKACSLLSLFLDSGYNVPIDSITETGLTPWNLAAEIGSNSRILCILRLLHRYNSTEQTVDDEGRNPLYNTAISLKGAHPLIVLERLIRSYLFLIHGDSPNMKTNSGDKAMDLCVRSNYHSLVDLLKTGLKEKEKVHNIIQLAWIDVTRTVFDKSEIITQSNDLASVMKWNDSVEVEQNMKTLIFNSLPYLSHCKFDLLGNVKPVDENVSSVPDLEHDSVIMK